MELTRRQSRILEVVEDYITDEGVAPSIREVAERVQCAISTAASDLKVLEAAGLLTRKGARSPRTLRVVKQQ